MSEAHLEVAAFWDGVVADFLEGGRPALRPPLDRWRSAYRGTGRGQVDDDAFPEPFVGPLTGRPRGVFLGLNPGPVAPEFQYRGGIYAEEIRQGSYTAWAAEWPYLREPWERLVGRNRHARSRLAFLRNWFGEQALGPDAMVTLELYPWHSTSLTAQIRPDPGIVRRFIWEPIAALDVAVVFAFGAPWFELLPQLGVAVRDRLGRGGRPYGSEVPSRAVLVGYTEEGSLVVAAKHDGSAVPPSAREVERLREAIP